MKSPRLIAGKTNMKNELVAILSASVTREDFADLFFSTGLLNLLNAPSILP